MLGHMIFGGQATSPAEFGHVSDIAESLWIRSLLSACLGSKKCLTASHAWWSSRSGEVFCVVFSSSGECCYKDVEIMSALFYPSVF